ncbi:MAG TPA: hypothetical protein VGJ81_05525 [Thermoanaerobaculia bacterium]|jgi:hypothetical protein
MKRVLALLVIALVFCVVAGCSDSQASIAEWFGAADRPPAAPVTEDILCDASSGSSCNTETLRETVDIALRKAAERPESIVRIWVQGRDIETTRIAAEVRSGAPHGTGRRARADYEARWVREASASIDTRTTAALRKSARRSPIAESIGLIALAPAVPGSTREIVAITDAMEVSDFGDFECGPLPKPERFTRLLAKNRVLPERSLKGVAVTFCHVDLGRIDRGRCPLSLLRDDQIRALWKAAFTAAGAKSVEIREGGLETLSITNLRKDTHV